MKKKWIIAAAALVVFIAGAAFLYNYLSEQYGGGNLVNDSQTGQQDAGASNGTQQAPDFTVIDADGNEVRLSDYKGKPVVLNFWATWCYYCKEEMPDFQEAFEKYPDVQFLMVNATDGIQETEQDARAYIAEQGFRFPVYFDTRGEAVTAYYVTGLPATYFIDKEGNLAAHGAGMLDLESIEKGISIITSE